MTTRRTSRPRSPRRLDDVRPTPLTVRELTRGARRGAAGLDPDRRSWPARESLLRRVRSEFDEMPGLRLTRRQAERLFGLREDICARILATLVADGLLVRTADGAYARRIAS